MATHGGMEHAWWRTSHPISSDTHIGTLAHVELVELLVAGDH
jgi:hypothetical protein